MKFLGGGSLGGPNFQNFEFFWKINFSGTAGARFVNSVLNEPPSLKEFLENIFFGWGSLGGQIFQNVEFFFWKNNFSRTKVVYQGGLYSRKIVHYNILPKMSLSGVPQFEDIRRPKIVKFVKQKLFVWVGYKVQKLSILTFYPKWAS